MRTGREDACARSSQSSFTSAILEGARSPPTTPPLLWRRCGGLRDDDADRRGPDEPEALGFGLDARRRIEAGALDHEERVLAAELVALRREALRLVARRRHRRGLSEIEQDDEEARDDHSAGEQE